MIYVLIILLCFLAWLVLLWRTRSPESCPDLRAFDVAGDGAVVEVGVCTRLAYEAAMACKEKYGDMRYNNANRLVVGDFCRQYLRATYPDLRVVDRVKHATYAVELALTPTLFAVQALRFSREAEVLARRNLVTPPK
jgi:hypothetical protein